ncbi:MAG: four helix bundle protein [Desulfurivibrionaceae bacterium]|nr:four helix bundle protein [Desulfurivibrionaceae bacterium]
MGVACNMVAHAKTFKDLKVWQKAHEFVLLTYQVTSDFPSHELFGLTSQFRRAAVSIPANIVEGFRKKGLKDKLRFYNIAQGSLEECRYYLILINDLHYTQIDTLQDVLEDTSRLLNAYARKIVSNDNKE